MSKTITIDELIPLLKKGWVAMDEDGVWGWYSTRPHTEGSIRERFWLGNKDRGSSMFFCFKIKRFKGDWKESLRRVK